MDYNLGMLLRIATTVVGGMLALLPHTCLAEEGSDLVGAASTGNLRDVKRLLAKGMKVDALGPNGQTALMSAAREGQVEIAELLIANKANVNARQSGGDEPGATPLMYATLPSSEGGKKTRMVALLLDKGANPNTQTPEGETALMFAVSLQDVEAVRLLVAHKANPDLRRNDGKTAFDFAKGKAPALLDLLRQTEQKPR